MVSEMPTNSAINTNQLASTRITFLILAVCLLIAFSTHAQDRGVSFGTQSDQRQLMTMRQAQPYLLRQMADGSDPIKQDLAECVIAIALKDIYREKATIEKPILDRSFKKFFEEFVRDENKSKAIMFRCFSNSKEVEKSVVGTNAQSDQRQLMTKQQAKAYLYQQIPVGAKPMEREILECIFSNALKDIYIDKTTVERSVLESSLNKYADELGKNDPKLNLMGIKCLANSKEVEKAILENRPVSQTQSRSSTYPLTDIDDLRVDMASMDGKRISVRGIGTYLMESFLLKKTKTDMNPIFIDTTKLAREHRREIISQCGNAMSTCRVTIYGAIGTVSYQKGIIAEQIEWQSIN
jgi:hypothetical protein